MKRCEVILPREDGGRCWDDAVAPLAVHFKSNRPIDQQAQCL